MIYSTEIAVRYAETDMMGIVHHSVFPIWFEIGRTEYIKKFGISYKEIEEKGIKMPLVELTSKFFSPAHYDDKLLIETCTRKITPAKMVFAYSVIRKADNILLSTGTTAHGFVDSVSFKPTSFKKLFPELFLQLKSSEVREEGVANGK